MSNPNNRTAATRQAIISGTVLGLYFIMGYLFGLLLVS